MCIRAIHVFTDYEALSHGSAAAIANAIIDGVRARGHVTLALAGGSTPERCYEHLATAHHQEVPWDNVHLFWGDERMVPPDDPASNTAMARRTLLAHVPLPETNVHAVDTTADDTPENAAAAYADTLTTFFNGPPMFDLVLLGLGTDGHTASLFPEDAPHEAPSDQWVTGGLAPPRHTPRERVSITLPTINRARQVFFLVSGSEKADALTAAREQTDPSLPAAHVAPVEALHWYVDAAAAGERT
ncbi:MAG: 6-phosphogluconolactonase [Bacteroidetes bacterium]|jgi:6-phosphogluconolactonase|nr:6-phosphogluconolactonase [Bacteroidota bacterium]